MSTSRNTQNAKVKNFYSSFIESVKESQIPETEKTRFIVGMDDLMKKSNVVYGMVIRKINTLKRTNQIDSRKCYRQGFKILNAIDNIHHHKMFTRSAMKDMMSDARFGNLPQRYADSITKIIELACEFFNLDKDTDNFLAGVDDADDLECLDIANDLAYDNYGLYLDLIPMD